MSTRSLSIRRSRRHNAATSTQRVRKAYHEAGHAVACLVQGLGFQGVSIGTEGETADYSLHPSPLDYHFSTCREHRSIARRCIVVSYAGIEAERLVEAGESEDGHTDLCRAFEVSRLYEVFPKYMNCVGDEAHVAYLKRLRAEARRLVKQHRGAIGRLAQALLNGAATTDDQVRDILRPTDLNCQASQATNG
jgi:ATP-dependent Zn protease